MLDTSELATRTRPRSWADGHAEIFFPIGVSFASEERTLGRIEARQGGVLSAYRVVSDASIVSRSAAGIRTHDPEQLLIALPLQGSSVVSQGGRSGVFTDRDLSSWHSSEPFEIRHGEAFDLLLFIIPRSLLGPRRDRICDRTAVRIPQGSRVGMIAAPFFRAVWRSLGEAGDDRADGDLADGAIALARALHASDPPESPAAGLPARALLGQIKAHIDERLADPGLGPGSIARAHFISTRYVHKLFAREGVSAAEWIRHRRLEICRRDLGDPTLDHLTVSEIARGSAFSNPAHFSRVFRAAYGQTPTEARAAARERRARSS